MVMIIRKQCGAVQCAIDCRLHTENHRRLRRDVNINIKHYNNTL